MVDVNVTPFEIEVNTRHGDTVRADVYLPKNGNGPFPVLLGASPYQKSLRYLPPAPPVFPFTEYGPIQLYLDEGYAYIAMDVPGMGLSEGTWDPVSRTEGEAIHDNRTCRNAGLGRADRDGRDVLLLLEPMERGPHPAAPPGDDRRLRRRHRHVPRLDVPGRHPDPGLLNSWLFGSVLLQHMGTGQSITDHGRAQVIYDMYDHPFDDAWQRRRSPFWELDQVDIPVLSIGAWGKASLHLRGNFEGFRLVKGPKQLLIVGAKTFAETQILFFEEEFHRAELLPWYDHHLKGVDNGVMDRPKVRFLTRGEEAEHSAADWPPPDVVVSELFLSGAKSGHETSLNDGSLAEALPTGCDGSTSWSYPDPQWMAGVTAIDAQGLPHHVARVVTYTTSWPPPTPTSSRARRSTSTAASTCSERAEKDIP